MAEETPFPELTTAEVQTSGKQGTVVKTTVSDLDPNRGSVFLVSITPNEYKSGDTVTIGDADYAITSVIKPTLKANSGNTLVQKSADINIPESDSAPTKRFSFLIVKSF